jgi:hypothetical protein
VSTTAVVGLVIAALDRLRARVPPGVLPWTVLAGAEARGK